MYVVAIGAHHVNLHNDKPTILSAEIQPPVSGGISFVWILHALTKIALNDTGVGDKKANFQCFWSLNVQNFQR